MDKTNRGKCGALPSLPEAAREERYRAYSA